jgi:Xaa-Pro aminopeptidase
MDSAMAEFVDRDLHLVKKAVAIAILAIERQPGTFQSSSDQADMKALLDRLIKSDTELEYYARAARIAVTGQPD